MAQVISFKELVAQVRTGFHTIQSDSRKVQAGDVFVAISGSHTDGAKFIGDAVNAGAAYVVCEKAYIPGEKAETIFVAHTDTRLALGELAGAKFGTEELSFPVVGITGTNGKTTITYLLEHLFAAAGHKVGVIGTVSYRWNDVEVPANMTTPDCIKVHSLLSRMAAADVGVAFMEVSSHALDQNRTAGVVYGGAVLTNLTQDHLDYHGDMETYFQAKARLFTHVEGLDKPAAINVDDEHGKRLLPDVANGVGFSLQGVTVDGCRVLQGEMLSCTVDGLHLRMTLDGISWELSSPLVGAHNASNLLAVQAIGLGLGLKVEELQGLANFTGVPGRLERVPNNKGIHAFVDYAHTPDALENVLTALRRVGFSRIITVFGCGGDRDRTKRPLMARAVCKHTDVAVLTSDNPRTEDPLSIIADTREGLDECTQTYEEVDRRKGLALAVELAQVGDCILVAGKGHEDYQQIGTEKFPFSDQQELRELFS